MTWANYISSDLRMRIGENRELPKKLTLQTLSAWYGVSPTPVRIAVSKLLQEDFLSKGSNGRLAINPEKLGSGGGGFPGNPICPPEDHFELIARDLVRLSLAGEEVELRESEIAERHRIGTRRVREILHRLAGLGMVKHLPRRGWRLVPFSEQALNEYLDTRHTLELRALELAMPYLVRADLERLRKKCLDQAASEQPLPVDNNLHQYIIEKSGNRYIQDFFQRHHQYFELLQDYETLHPDIQKVRLKAVKLHVRILDALIRSDENEAKQALSEDIRSEHPLLDMHRQALRGT